jgi:hypothetical protein
MHTYFGAGKAKHKLIEMQNVHFSLKLLQQLQGLAPSCSKYQACNSNGCHMHCLSEKLPLPFLESCGADTFVSIVGDHFCVSDFICLKKLGVLGAGTCVGYYLLEGRCLAAAFCRTICLKKKADKQWYHFNQDKVFLPIVQHSLLHQSSGWYKGEW